MVLQPNFDVLKNTLSTIDLLASPLANSFQHTFMDTHPRYVDTYSLWLVQTLSADPKV